MRVVLLQPVGPSCVSPFPLFPLSFRSLLTISGLIGVCVCVWVLCAEPLNSEPCSVSSSHSFSTLLGVDSGYSGCNCPPGRSGSHCQNGTSYQVAPPPKPHCARSLH